MPFKIIRDDITRVSADAIVNSANPHAIIGDGVDAAINMAAGPRLIEARKKIGDIAVGEVRYSRAFNLLARYVFHTVGPDCRKAEDNVEENLKSCYTKCLQLAKKLYCESIAFPLISSGIYDCPKDKALQIAVSAISEFLMQNEMEVTLVVYDPDAYVLSTKLFDDVKAYVDQHYVESVPKDAGIEGLEDTDLRKMEHLTRNAELSEESRRDLEDDAINAMDFRSLHQEITPVGTLKPAAMPGIGKIMATREPGAETFSEMLVRLIDLSGKSDAEVYRKASQTRQLFSKIRSQRNYQPSKNTVLSFAIALELNMDQTLDLLKSAGYALSDGIRLDVAIRFFIEAGFYDLMEIKITLFGIDITF